MTDKIGETVATVVTAVMLETVVTDGTGVTDEKA